MEVAKLNYASANRPGERERIYAEYSRIKKVNPAAAEKYLDDIYRGSSGAGGGKGVMTRDQAIDNVNKQMVDPMLRMELTKEAAAGLGKKTPTISEVMEFHVKKNLGELTAAPSTSPLPKGVTVTKIGG
jgi:hypothetical protein